MSSQESSRSASPQSGPSRPPRQAPQSSVAFLHHLHTDPSSHHVSLTGSLSTRGTSPLDSRPIIKASPVKALKQKKGDVAAISFPLEPTVITKNAPPTRTSRSSTPSESPSNSSRPLDSPSGTPSPVKRTVLPELSPPIAGPSSLTSLSRSGSRRGRPKTAPGRALDMTSPEALPVVQLEDTPFIQSQDNTPQEGMDSCTTAFADDSAVEAMQLMSMSDRRNSTPDEPPTRVFGRAGPTSSSEVPRSAKFGSPEELDWETFATAYSNGNFNPNRIPLPPKSSSNFRPIFTSGARSDGTRSSSTSTATMSQTTGSSGSATTFTSTSSAPATSVIGSGSKEMLPAVQSGMAAAIAARKKAFELESIDQRSAPMAPANNVLKPDSLALPSYTLAAATVRMASQPNSDFGPFVPSPDKELMDPMSSLLSASKESASSDPGSTRYPLSRSLSSVQTNREAFHLPTIAASPTSTPLEHPAHRPLPADMPRRTTSPDSILRLRQRAGGIVQQSKIAPATAPLEKTVEAENEADYFGSAVSPKFDRHTSYTSQSSSSNSNQTVTQQPTPMVKSNTPPPMTEISSPIEELPPSIAYPADVGGIYEKFGWMAAPMPPDEMARRKALYRFNILYTAPDVNFDRIAHMTKLMFNTKIVLIALIDGERQWHKTESGLGSEEAKRINSLCSHTILSKTDEPFILLDSLLDWRFVNNPQVTGAPHIRFYAGAPLRTADGHNLGSLCIIDDKPRSEFPPRHRLILKELAAVTMREMELWRDKLQLRVRDKIQTSMEKFTRECLEMDARSTASNAEAAAKMDQVYTRAAQLVCQTLDMDGCFILDLGEFQQFEVDTPEGKRSVYRADPYSVESQSNSLELSEEFGEIPALPVLAATTTTVPTRPLTGEEHQKMSDFLSSHRDGRIFENVAPSWIRYMFPPDLRYGMVVPCFGINQQPFALITAYTTNKAKHYLEGYELQFLRAIGVIILSAVLRRRMVLADKTKSVLISSVSHELRTPLHGILAAAELLMDTRLDSNQEAFLKTVQTCGNTLIETVNHVLDFTKLSGAAGSSNTSIKLTKINLAHLVEETVDGVWIGQRARMYSGAQDSDVGSFYAPPALGGNVAGLTAQDRANKAAKESMSVETVVDIGHREKGWVVKCEKGGLRRILMNLVGNSLKFTKEGYIQITLKEMPHSPGAKKIPIEMAVVDTGRGIGKQFLKDQLFHPFSQENPLQTGTGLGLAIVNSIVRSEGIDGKVDVWSSIGAGTEIRISFEAEVFDEEEDTSSSSSTTSTASSFGRGHSVHMVGFDLEKRGHLLAVEILSTAAAKWSFELKDNEKYADILVINEDETHLRSYAESGKAIIFYTSRQSAALMEFRDLVNNSGGICHILHKPIAPTMFRKALHKAVIGLETEPIRPPMERGDSGESANSNSTISDLSHARNLSSRGPGSGSGGSSDHGRFPVFPLMRRRSEEQEASSRPSMAPRGITYHHPTQSQSPKTAGFRDRSRLSISDEGSEPKSYQSSPQPSSSSPKSTTSQLSTVNIGEDNAVTILRAAQIHDTRRSAKTMKVMIVEDNQINRSLLAALLRKHKIPYAEAHDGQEAVAMFEANPANYWDMILMDISMPVMNGLEATRAIRKMEETRRKGFPAETPPAVEHDKPILIASPNIVQGRTKIFALTGHSSDEDKRQAFGSGVDGYMIKPVKMHSLESTVKRLGFDLDETRQK